MTGQNVAQGPAETDWRPSRCTGQNYSILLVRQKRNGGDIGQEWVWFGGKVF